MSDDIRPVSAQDALPLLMTHGWPGSVVEFGKVVGPLTDPERYAAQEQAALASLAYHGKDDSGYSTRPPC